MSKDEKCCDQLKEPTDAMVMTGYMLEKYAREGTKYLQEALKCIGTAVTQAKAQGEDINLMDLVEERQAIISLMHQTQEAQKIHVALANRLSANGYRKLTDSDFSKLGVGSNR